MLEGSRKKSPIKQINDSMMSKTLGNSKKTKTLYGSTPPDINTEDA